MKSLFFGPSTYQYDYGVTPRCAINQNWDIVAVHKSGSEDTLWYWYGRVLGTEVTMTGHGPLDESNGRNPSVAIHDKTAIEIHTRENDELWYSTGQIADGNVKWGARRPLNVDGRRDGNKGQKPSVAVNARGQVVEVHQAGGDPSELWYWVGELTGATIKWTGHNRVGGKDPGDEGANPSIVVGENGFVLVVHDSGKKGELLYRVGQLGGSSINWGAYDRYGQGYQPSISLADHNTLIEVHREIRSPPIPLVPVCLCQRVGRLTGGLPPFEWFNPFGMKNDSYLFDYGSYVSASFNGKVGVQVHQSQSTDTLWATASYWFDRSSWMEGSRAVLQNTPLSELVMPASHNSGMYTKDQHQDLDVHSQLLAGCRFFDLRVGYKGGKFVIIRDNNDDGDGLPLVEVLGQVNTFLGPDRERHNELVILKFSRYGWGSDKSIFDQMCGMIYDQLGPLLYAAKLEPNSRLAAKTLGDFIDSGRPCLAVCDGPHLPPGPGSGQQGKLWAYRDWFATNADEGELTVFDVYSHTESLLAMASGTDPDESGRGLLRGQLPKFGSLGKTCMLSSFPCDLFLLSWTLTFGGSRNPQPTDPNNSFLGLGIAGVGKNPAGRVINLLYCDMIQYTRASDVSVFRNGSLPTLLASRNEPGVAGAASRAAVHTDG